MPPPASELPSWRPSIVAATVALAICTFWPLENWSPFAIAAAAYFALPPAQRTRASASLIGWSVGFALTLLLSVLRTLRD